MSKPTGRVPPRVPGLIWLGPEMPSDNRQSRRQRRRELARVARVVTEADIPPGSLLSEATLEAIRAGMYGMSRPAGTPTPGGKLARQMMRRRAFGN